MSSDKTHIGQVLWFDQKKGFGFVKVNHPESDFHDKEIFVHFSSIHTELTNYKKLFPGEYISMDIKHQPDVKGKEYNCLNLTGVNGGTLLVEHEKYNFKVYNKPNIMHNKNTTEDNDKEYNVEEDN